MPAKRGLFIVILAVVAFLAISMPHQASAAPVTDPCAGGVPDQNFQKAATNEGQRLANDISNAWAAMLKTDLGATSQCMQQFIQAYNGLAQMINGITDPADILINAVAGAVAGMIASLIGSVCQSVVGALQNIKSTISSLAHICIPLPQFNLKLNLPNLDLEGCSGGMQINLLTPGAYTPSGSGYGNQWFGH